MEETQTVPTGENGSGWTPKNAFTRKLDSFFHISERGSSIFRELIGGLVTFLAMFYIMPVNADVLTGWGGHKEGMIQITSTLWATAQDVWAAIFVSTAVSSCIATILMGLVGKLPIGLSSGLSISSFIAYTVMLRMGFTFAEAMAIILVDGFIFLIISVTPLRQLIVKSIPKSLKFAITAGIGGFVAFIGLADAGIIVAANSGSPVTFGNLADPSVLMSIIGIALVIVIAFLGRNKALGKWGPWVERFSVFGCLLVMGIICGILGECGVGGFAGFYSESFNIREIGNFTKVFGVSLTSGWSAFANPMAYMIMFSLLFVDFFDTTGTLVAVESGTGMMDENGQLKYGYDDRPAMIVDSLGTCFGAICGNTGVTSFVESTTGVAAGARTGLAAVVTGALFGLSILIFPALSMFTNAAATSLALVYVGILMFQNLDDLEWKDLVSVGSAFITVIIMIVSYSICDGISWGFISYVLMSLAAGRFQKKDIPIACCALVFLVVTILRYSMNIV